MMSSLNMNPEEHPGRQLGHVWPVFLSGGNTRIQGGVLECFAGDVPRNRC